MVWRTQEIAHRIAIITSQNPCSPVDRAGVHSPTAQIWPSWKNRQRNPLLHPGYRIQFQKFAKKKTSSHAWCREQVLQTDEDELFGCSQQQKNIFPAVIHHDLGLCCCQWNWEDFMGKRNKFSKQTPRKSVKKKLNLIRVNIIYLSQRFFFSSIWYDIFSFPQLSETTNQISCLVLVTASSKPAACISYCYISILVPCKWSLDI